MSEEARVVPEEVGMLSHFSSLPDPRVERTKQYPLIEILAVALCAILCGADDFVAVATFGRAREEWLRERLGIGHGIPAHDTFRRVFIGNSARNPSLQGREG